MKTIAKPEKAQEKTFVMKNAFRLYFLREMDAIIN